MRREPEEILHLTQHVEPEQWRQHADGMRPYFHRAVAEELMKWLLEHGPAVISKPLERVTTSDWGMATVATTKVEYIVYAEPLGTLRDEEYYFLGGPADGQSFITDGSMFWLIPIIETPSSPAWDFKDVSPQPVAVYRRSRYYYRFERIDR